MSFILDKEVGEAFEQRVINLFKKEFDITLVKNTNPKGVDLVCGNMDKPLFTAEVKWDRRVLETGNAFIEIWNNHQEAGTGLFAYAQAPPLFFIIGYETETLVFNTKALQDLVTQWREDGVHRVINAGDGWRSKGMIVPIEQLQDNALFIFYNNI